MDGILGIVDLYIILSHGSVLTFTHIEGKSRSNICIFTVPE